MPEAQAEQRADWLARLLSSRGIPVETSPALEHSEREELLAILHLVGDT